nr:protein spiral1-like 2 [Quercus suber]
MLAAKASIDQSQLWRILESAMSRGGSYGGGQSSLGYLFGSDEQPSTASPPPRPVNPPPYGIDSTTTTTTTTEKPPDSRSPTEKQKVSNNYHRAQGQNSGNFITDRPSTKVKSVPGGDSSLGYLFGDNCFVGFDCYVK